MKALLRRNLRRFLIFGAVALVLLSLCGIAYQQIGEHRDRKLAPQIGRSVEVAGRTLNIYCSGEGSPTVIFEGDWGFPGYSWLHIQQDVAKFTRACWYDRAGYGWSDPGPSPNHSDSIARDLHRLLEKAHTAPPYVLVAHAIGAFHARVFRGFYPNEVEGMVLVDPTSEDLTIHIHNHIELFRPAVLLLHQIMGEVGYMRLRRMPLLELPKEGFTQQEWNELEILQWQTKSLVAEGKEPPLWICGEQARAAGALGDIPVIVLSAGIQDREEDPKLSQDHTLKLTLQHTMAALSSRGSHRIISNSGHWIPFDAPGSVVSAARDVIDAIREKRKRPIWH
jgi:pimeloyl-ACP methyl ester carboxylesterase